MATMQITPPEFYRVTPDIGTVHSISMYTVFVAELKLLAEGHLFKGYLLPYDGD
jgi:hypothetical protein